MRNWPVAAGLDQAPHGVRPILERISAAFARHGETAPRVMGAAICRTDSDPQIYELFFELAPGVVLSTTFGSPEDIEGPDFPTGIETSVAEEAEISIRSHLAMGVERLADILHDLRKRARRTLAALSGGSGGGRLIDVRLTADSWHQPGEVKVVLRLEGVDEHLRTVVEEVRIDDLGTFDAKLHKWGTAIATRHVARRAFALEGASGSIDLLTMNVISDFTDLRGGSARSRCLTGRRSPIAS